MFVDFYVESVVKVTVQPCPWLYQRIHMRKKHTGCHMISCLISRDSHREGFMIPTPTPDVMLRMYTCTSRVWPMRSHAKEMRPVGLRFAKTTLQALFQPTRTRFFHRSLSHLGRHHKTKNTFHNQIQEEFLSISQVTLFSLNTCI